jgi:hypothetical protein
MFFLSVLDTCAGNFLLMSLRFQAEVLTCADPEARTPIGMSRKINEREAKKKVQELNRLFKVFRFFRRKKVISKVSEP